nr:hypothetical protein GCM10023233_21060 [Brevibacterium otitidis]
MRRVFAPPVIALSLAFSLLATPAMASAQAQSPDTGAVISGVEISGGNLTSKESADGSVDFSFRGPSIETPDELKWEHGLEGGVYAVDSSGEFRLVVSAPEVAGNVVAWAIDGNELKVDTDRPVGSERVNAAAGISLIKSVKRGTEKRKPRYMISPTKVGRFAPSAVHATAGWNEAKRKGVNRPTQGLKEQYVCHPMSKVARLKSTWNIESWRPTVGLPRTLAAACNPK